MTDVDVVEHAGRLFGRAVTPIARRQPHHKPSFKLSISGGPAYVLMSALKPLFGERRQAQISSVVAQVIEQQVRKASESIAQLEEYKQLYEKWCARPEGQSEREFFKLAGISRATGKDRIRRAKDYLNGPFVPKHCAPARDPYFNEGWDGLSPSVKLAWLAGLLEGEGCFVGRGHQVRTEVSMTDLDIVLRVASFGKFMVRKRTAKKQHWKTAWTAALKGPGAEKLMSDILPFMGKRRSARIKQLLDARKALAVWSRTNPDGTQYRYFTKATPLNTLSDEEVHGLWVNRQEGENTSTLSRKLGVNSRTLISFLIRKGVYELGLRGKVIYTYRCKSCGVDFKRSVKRIADACSSNCYQNLKKPL